MTSHVQVGDVVRLTLNGSWADSLLMIVEDVRPWGLRGVVPTPQGDAPMRAALADIAVVWRRVLDS
jgi:hypothetical protein